jgi:hypothetical protein
MIQKPTTTDPILDEIHRTRREISERFGGDLRAILDDARKRQAASGRPVWSPGAANHAMQRSDGGDVSDNGKSTPAAR